MGVGIILGIKDHKNWITRCVVIYAQSQIIKDKYIEHNYSASSDLINMILGSLDRSQFPLSNKYKFIRVAYIYKKLLMILS